MFKLLELMTSFLHLCFFLPFLFVFCVVGVSLTVSFITKDQKYFLKGMDSYK